MLEQTVDSTSRKNNPWAGGTREVRGPHGAGSARGARSQLGANGEEMMLKVQKVSLQENAGALGHVVGQSIIERFVGGKCRSPWTRSRAIDD